MSASPPSAQPEESAPVLPDVQKAFWLPGDLHARFVALLAQRRKSEPRMTERALLTEAVRRLLDGAG